MKRIAILLAVLFAVPLAGGCSSSSSPGAALVAPDDSAIAQGIVVQVNPVFIVDSLADAPAGASPVTAEIRVLDRSGTVVAQTTSGADGTFRLSELPAGLLRAEVRVDAANAEPDLVQEFTSVPGIVIPLGREFAVDRATAATAALQGVDESALVAGSMQPFPAGTTIGAAVFLGIGAAETPPLVTLAGDAWLFFVNPTPQETYAHPCEYVLVDAATGAVTRLAEGVEWYPNVNGADLWSGNEELFDFPEDAAPVATSEVVQEPPVLELQELHAGARVAGESTTDLENTFVLHIHGFPRDRALVFADDNLRIEYVRLGVPAANIRTITPFGRSLEQFQADLEAEFARAAAYSKDSLFILHISSHGTRISVSESGTLTNRGAVVLPVNEKQTRLERKKFFLVAKATGVVLPGFETVRDRLRRDRDSDDAPTVAAETVGLVGLEESGLFDVGSCNVAVIVDTCHAGQLACDLADAVQGRPAGDDVATFEIFGACQPAESALSTGGSGIFTRALLANTTIEELDLTFPVSATNELLPPLDRLTSPILRPDFEQFPVFKLRERDDCLPPPPLRIEDDFLIITAETTAAIHRLGIDDLPQRIASLRIESKVATGLQLSFGFIENFPDFGLQGENGVSTVVLEPFQTITWNLEYNGGGTQESYFFELPLDLNDFNSQTQIDPIYGIPIELVIER